MRTFNRNVIDWLIVIILISYITLTFSTYYYFLHWKKYNLNTITRNLYISHYNLFLIILLLPCLVQGSVFRCIVAFRSSNQEEKIISRTKLRLYMCSAQIMGTESVAYTQKNKADCFLF